MNNRDVELTVAGYCETIGPKRDRRSRDTKVFEKRTGRAGFGCVLRCDKAVKVIENGLTTKSETRATLAGIVAGLRALRNPGAVSIYTVNDYLDKDLVVMEKQLRRAHPTGLYWYPDKNTDLWRDFVELIKDHPLSLRCVELKYDKDFYLARSVARMAIFGGESSRYITNPLPRYNYSGCLR